MARSRRKLRPLIESSPAFIEGKRAADPSITMRVIRAFPEEDHRHVGREVRASLGADALLLPDRKTTDDVSHALYLHRHGALVTTARVLREYMQKQQLFGGCHHLSALGYVLLREQAIDAELCIGVAYVGRSPFPGFMGIDFDHSWLEINGRPFDVACAQPLPPSIPLEPVVEGIHMDDGRRSEIEYGVAGTLDEPAADIARQTLGAYAVGFDCTASEYGFWEAAELLCKRLGLSDAAALERRYAATRWTVRS